MNTLVPILFFSADACLVAWAAWLAVCAAGLHRRGLVEASLGWLLLALAWIASSGVLLGLGGGLGRTGFFIIHAAGLVALLVGRRSWREDGRHWLDWLAAWGRLLRGGTAEGRLIGGLMVILLLLAVLSAQVEPIVFDALTYRLSRIGAWLQDGTIRHFATDDPRLNYMPVAPDVVIAWLLGATNNGFYLAPWSQLAGGLLLLGATYGLARTAGLARLNALGAVALVLGMANVAVQFTTVQSDLFTAGVFAASYLLWHRALQRGEGSWAGGTGVALAFASKGTMFYLAPGAALWVGWLAWRHRDRWRALLPTAAGLGVAALILVLPGYWRNQATYGSMFGPRDAVVLHHGAFASPVHYAEKAVRNLGTSAVQLLEPTAQPFWLQDVSRAAGEKLAGRMPAEADAYVFIGQSRREQLERVMQLAAPDADVVTCGIISVVLFLGGLLLAAVRKREGAGQILVWGGGVLVYLLVQHALVQWHQWAFRFMVLAAPWVAVTGAWGLGALPRKLRVAAWAVVLGSAAEVFVMGQARTSQAAWPALTQPERSASYFYYRNWRTWAGQLDQPDTPLRLAFPIDHALASFYRLDPPRPVVIERWSDLKALTAEAAVGSAPGWLVVPLEQFMGREGRVMGRTGLFNLAAYRRLQPGERPQPLLYNYRARNLGGTLRDELLLRTWADVPVRLEFANPRTTACRFELRTSTATLTQEVPAGAHLVLEVPVPADVPAWVTIDYAPAAAGEGNLRIRLGR
ncbi:MAG TPA: glycosyltransferase family 39 protein [Lacunisphaera sp.]